MSRQVERLKRLVTPDSCVVTSPSRRSSTEAIQAILWDHVRQWLHQIPADRENFAIELIVSNMLLACRALRNLFDALRAAGMAESVICYNKKESIMLQHGSAAWMRITAAPLQSRHRHLGAQLILIDGVESVPREMIERIAEPPTARVIGMLNLPFEFRLDLSSVTAHDGAECIPFADCVQLMTGVARIEQEFAEMSLETN